MKLAITAAALAIGLGVAGQAAAVNVTNVISTQGTARCQGALPNFEGAFRKRPLVYKNEGTASAFVTCAFPINSGTALGGGDGLDVYFSNDGAADASITCNAVSGYYTGTNEYSSKSVTVPAGTQGDLFWQETDFPTNGLGDGLITISCQLPVATGINDTYTVWVSDDATTTP
jgi:hypothetical protein